MSSPHQPSHCLVAGRPGLANGQGASFVQAHSSGPSPEQKSHSCLKHMGLCGALGTQANGTAGGAGQPRELCWQSQCRTHPSREKMWSEGTLACHPRPELVTVPCKGQERQRYFGQRRPSPGLQQNRVRTRPGCLHCPCKAAPQNALPARNPAGCKVPPRATCCLHESTWVTPGPPQGEAAQVLPLPHPETAGSHPSTSSKGLPQVPRTIWQPCSWGHSSLPANPA